MSRKKRGKAREKKNTRTHRIPEKHHVKYTSKIHSFKITHVRFVLAIMTTKQNYTLGFFAVASLLCSMAHHLPLPDLCGMHGHV